MSIIKSGYLNLTLQRKECGNHVSGHRMENCHMLQGLSGAKEPTLLLSPEEASKRPAPLGSTSNKSISFGLDPQPQQATGRLVLVLFFFFFNYSPPAFTTSVT